MPGILGLVFDIPADALRSALDRMIRPLVRSPLLAADSLYGQQAGLAAVTLRGTGSPMARRAGPEGEVWLACYGVAHFDNGPVDDAALAGRLIERFLRGGIPALRGLNGTHVIAVWEAGPRRLTLVKDRMGYSKLYYWQDGARLMFASEYKAISWHPAVQKALDLVAVADQFLHGAPIEGRTMFRDIHNLPPASTLTFQDGRVQIDTYWSPPHCPPGVTVQPDHVYADGLAERMRAAVRRRLRPNTCLLITGGLDSRIVAGMYRAVDPDGDLVTATLGLPHGQDVQVGRALAGALRLPHHHVPLDTAYLARWAAANTWRTEAKLGAYASWIAAQGPFLFTHGLRYALTGLYGNHISGRHYPPELLRARTLAEGVAAVDTFLNPHLGRLRHIMRPEIFRSAGLESAAALGRIFRAGQADTLIQRADDFNFYYRISRQANTEDSLGDYALALEPFIDHDVFDYAVGQIPPQVRARSLFYHQLILRHLPRAAGVVYGSTGRSIAAEYAVRSSPLRSELDGYVWRLLKRLFPNQFGHDARASVPHKEAIRGGSRAYVEEAFRQTDLYADLFDPRAVQHMLDEHVAGRANTFMTIDALLTIILWRRQFCELEGPLPEDRLEELSSAQAAVRSQSTAQV